MAKLVEHIIPTRTARRAGELHSRVEPVPVPIDFQFLLEPAAGTDKRRAGTAVTSLLVHGLLLTLALLLPLVYTETLDVRQLASTWLVAPLPPPPPPPPPAPLAKAALRARRIKPVVQTLEGKLLDATRPQGSFR